MRLTGDANLSDAWRSRYLTLCKGGFANPMMDLMNARTLNRIGRGAPGQGPSSGREKSGSLPP
jgi:hypothetical protein